MAGDLRTDALGIKIEDDFFDRGYWARFNGSMRRPSKRQERAGWDTCNAELRAERRTMEREWVDDGR